jgi:hypothetical protein
MKRNVLFTTVAVLAGSLLATQAAPSDEVKAAARKLADQGNYSWRTTVEVGDDARWRPGPTEGKTEKGGCMHLTMTRGDNTYEAVMKGAQGAVKTEDGWKSFAEASEGDSGQRNPGRMIARLMQNFKVPAAQAEDIVTKTKGITKTDGAYTGELTEEGAKDLMTFGRRREGGEGLSVSNAKGSVKFWLKDGLLSKYEFKVQGKMTFNDNDIEIDRTTTVEIKDVGATKLEVPDDAKKKLS